MAAPQTSHTATAKQSPPTLLKDKKATICFKKGKLLGEGGFAKCYEVLDEYQSLGGGKFAAKVINKSCLKSTKQRQKLYSEIKIHQMLSHENIVKFYHVFEDAENVYMILELCEDKTFVDLMREEEAKGYLKQICLAVQYMHSKKVIHRDLKLGNLFFSGAKVKIGDFGLAALLLTQEDRKKTICGTPNYIAPEILYCNGHSFAVDIWSIGVILYTLLVGKPPFQGGKDVKEIYKRIRDGKYQIPSDLNLSDDVLDLLAKVLVTDPEKRISLKDILNHSWFNEYSEYKTATSVIKIEEKVKNLSIKENAAGSRKTVKNIGDVKKLTLQEERKPLGKVAPNVAAKETTRKNSFPSKENVTPNTKNIITLPNSNELTKKTVLPSPTASTVPNPPTKRRSMLESLYNTLDSYFKLMQDPSFHFSYPSTPPVEPTLFVSKWIDYSNKYGLGYQLTNNNTGVYFNDCTSLVMSADGNNFEYLTQDAGVIGRRAYTKSNLDSALSKKVKLIKYFEEFMRQNLSKSKYKSEASNLNMHFVVRYFHSKHAILFRLSNNSLQINFFDHCKVIICGDVVRYLGGEGGCFWLGECFEKKREVLERLAYVKDCLGMLLSK